jgi:putative protein-disulfide isomerase
VKIDRPDQELIYVGDPMCSWCWGIAPELDAVQRSRPDLPLKVVVGGLRPGPNAEEMDDRLAGYLRHHWDEVSERSGQPFATSTLDQRGWVYDTEPSCKAVVVMRQLDEQLAWPLFKRLQRAFYSEGTIVSDPSTIPLLVREFDVDMDAFVEAFESPEATKATWQDFAAARQWGISGFPTVIARNGETGHLVAQGYSTAADMKIAIAQALSPTGEAACAPGEVC